MRILPAVLSSAIILSVGQAASAQPDPGCPGPTDKAGRHWVGQPISFPLAEENFYVVECRIVKESADGKRDVQIGPRLTVADGGTAIVNDVTQTPIVASVRRKRSGDEARITVLKEGTAIELSVYDQGDGWATLDATIETSQIRDLKQKDAGVGRHRQCARLESRRVRVLELTALGDEIKVPLTVAGGDERSRTIEFAVYSPDMPSHWTDKRQAAERKSWLSRMWLITLRAFAAL